jgi:hypothetical protein
MGDAAAERISEGCASAEMSAFGCGGLKPRPPGARARPARTQILKFEALPWLVRRLLFSVPDLAAALMRAGAVAKSLGLPPPGASAILSPEIQRRRRSRSFCAHGASTVRIGGVPSCAGGLGAESVVPPLRDICWHRHQV